MRFSASFGRVEAILADVHGVASDRRSALQARLKNFMRLGLADDVKAGRGKAAKYEAHHILQFALALELAQMGVGPERAVHIIQRNIPSIAAAVIASVSKTREGFGEGWSPTVIYFDPNNMASLNKEGEAKEIQVHFRKLDEFEVEFGSVVGKNSRLAVISITAVIMRLGEALVNPEMKKLFAFDRFFGSCLVDWAEAITEDIPVIYGDQSEPAEPFQLEIPRFVDRKGQRDGDD